MTASHPAIDVIIVNWNGGHAVVDSARSGLDFGARVIVVDNASSDGSAERIERALRDVSVVRMGYNAGFAAACNHGAAQGEGEFVFLLNPDARIVAGSPADVLRAFSHEASPAIVGPRIEADDGKLARSARRFPTPASLVLYQLKLHRLARWIPPLRAYLMIDADFSRPMLVDQPMGAAFIMRRSDWDRFDGMDEAYFLWFEEVDLAKRVSDAGGAALYWPAIAVRHTGGTSFARLSGRHRQRLWNRSAVRYAERHFGPVGAAMVRLTLPVSTTLNWAADRVRSRRSARLLTS
jgi:N-acetylglucosaminyl-diphospho-decaprenol L-rhamnosyltransferase